MKLHLARHIVYRKRHILSLFQLGKYVVLHYFFRLGKLRWPYFGISHCVALGLGVEAEKRVLQPLHIVREPSVRAAAPRIHLETAPKLHAVKALEAELGIEC